MWEIYPVSLLVKLAAAASIASFLARSNRFKSLLMKEARTIGERLALTAWLATLFGASVGMRVVSRTYQGADLGLEGAFIAGAIGGYICGLCSGVLIALPAVLMGEHLTLPFLAGIGVLGGLLQVVW